MVTRILFDPRRDLPTGATQSNPVTIEATPTGIREDGQVVIYPTTITFTITTGADILQLPANTASNGWRLTVRDKITSTILQTRVVRVPDQASIAYQSLPDIDPSSFEVTPGTARQWDATFWALVQAGAGGGLTDSGIAALIGVPTSAVALALTATYLPFWKPNTAYLAGQRVVSPTGQTITANADFTSGASYVAGNWTVVAGGGGGTVSDATTSAKGIVQLAGDLAGTAAAPTVPGLATKAPLASPAFTGTPAVPTATADTVSTQAASTAFVKAAIDALVAGAPGALDTLGEIATQLAADETAAAALTALLNQRTMSAAPVTLTASGTLTPNVQNLLDATSGPLTATLPAPTRIGQLLVIERADTSTNLISLAGTVRGVTTGLPTLPGLGVRGESITFAAESTSSWRILASHKPKALLDQQFASLAALSTLIAYVDNGDGTATITGPGITDNGDGTITFTSSAGSVLYKKSQLDTLLAAKAPLASPAFTGTPTAPTPATADSSTAVATTAFVKAQGYAAGGGGATVNVQTFTANGTWTKPAGVTTVQVVIIGAGAGGGSGRRTASGAVAGGGGGGGGGGMSTGMYPAAALPGTVAVTCASGGNGGTAVGTDSTNGAAGSPGGASLFGLFLQANGGNNGSGGTTAGGTSGGSASSAQFQGSGGAAGGAGAAGVQAGLAQQAAAGGGGGGGISVTPAAFNGGAGGTAITTGNTAAAGTAGGPGTAGLTAAAGAPIPVGGGAGGASSITAAGGAGGAGGSYGGGGGGGGASLNGFASGAGGQGGPGIVVVTSW